MQLSTIPSPLDIPPIKGDSGRRTIVERPANDDEPFSALAFKIVTDPYVGRLCYFRVYSGKLKTGSYILNSTKNKKERIGRILLMHANHREHRHGFAGYCGGGGTRIPAREILCAAGCR